MPEYDYLCETCGPFSDIRPMAAYAARVAVTQRPAPC
jgi:hypothetical protein